MVFSVNDHCFDTIIEHTVRRRRKPLTTIRILLLEPVLIGRFGAALKSIELLDTAERPAMDARVKAFKSDTPWMMRQNSGYVPMRRMDFSSSWSAKAVAGDG